MRARFKRTTKKRSKAESDAACRRQKEDEMRGYLKDRERELREQEAKMIGEMILRHRGGYD